MTRYGRLLACSAGIAIATGLASPAATAAPPEEPHGVGVCISQVAIDPSVVGADRLGELMKQAAGPRQPGSGVPALKNDARGDGPNGCGAPPGPHQHGN